MKNDMNNINKMLEHGFKSFLYFMRVCGGSYQKSIKDMEKEKEEHDRRTDKTNGDRA